MTRRQFGSKSGFRKCSQATTATFLKAATFQFERLASRAACGSVCQSRCRRHHGLRREMLLRVVPEEGQDVLPEDSTPWAKEHSNRSLRTEVSVAGERNFQGGDKAAETAVKIQRTPLQRQNLA